MGSEAADLVQPTRTRLDNVEGSSGRLDRSTPPSRRTLQSQGRPRAAGPDASALRVPRRSSQRRELATSSSRSIASCMPASIDRIAAGRSSLEGGPALGGRGPTSTRRRSVVSSSGVSPSSRGEARSLARPPSGLRPERVRRVNATSAWHRACARRLPPARPRGCPRGRSRRRSRGGSLASPRRGSRRSRSRCARRPHARAPRPRREARSRTRRRRPARRDRGRAPTAVVRPTST